MEFPLDMLPASLRELVDRVSQDLVILCFLGSQILLFALLWYLCRRRLHSTTRLARRLVRAADGGDGPSGLRSKAGEWEELKRALDDLARSGTQSPHGRAVHDELSADALLPSGYNPRLDAAAPGLFTAVGILGTFCGLIIAFLNTNAADASGSIDPLMRGMTVAFVNSIVGVGLAVLWTLWAKTSRHKFDIACQQLEPHLRRLFDLRSPAAVHAADFAALTRAMTDLTVSFTQEVGALADAASASSRDLLEQLAPKLQESLKGLVTAPFETLAVTVQRFDAATQTVALKQVELLEQVQHASRTLAAATSDLSRSADLVQAQVDTFGRAAAALEQHTTSASNLVAATHAAGHELVEVRDGLARGTAVMAELLQNLTATREALVGSSDAMAAGADMFREATGRLDAAIGNLSQAAGAAVSDSMVNVRKDLAAAADEIANSMARTGETTVAAYEAASAKVANTIDEQMSDLADRLRAQLDTLAAQVPAAMSNMEEVTNESRKAIIGAIRSLESASSTLAARSNDMLKEHLQAYDEAIREAVDRFSGTLAQWEERVEAFEGVTQSFGRLIERNGNGTAR